MDIVQDINMQDCVSGLVMDVWVTIHKQIKKLPQKAAVGTVVS